eukprot:4610911-Pleurochrysis_carterae.AAC.2
MRRLQKRCGGESQATRDRGREAIDHGALCLLLISPKSCAASAHSRAARDAALALSRRRSNRRKPASDPV